MMNKNDQAIQHFAAEGAPAAIGPYSHAVKAGNLLFLSGQLGMLPEGTLAGDDIASQTEQALKNVGVILAAGGASFEDAVSVTCYLADMRDFAAFNEIYARFFTRKPARTCIAVAGLPKGALCEIQVIACLGK